jgi:8-oxo-dGTP diphosphatase
MNQTPKNPYVTVDIIIEIQDGIVLVQRRNPPLGWALPGGFVDYGETLEAAARREALEETGLSVKLLEQFHTYSAPDRDPRHHTISTVFIATAKGSPQGADDALQALVFRPATLPRPIVFDHGGIISEYLAYRRGTSKEALFRL